MPQARKSTKDEVRAKSGSKKNIKITSKKVKSAKYGKKNKGYIISSDVKDEIILVLMVALGILILLSVYTDNMGLLGILIGSLFKGLIGIGAYILPIIIIFCGVFLIFQKKAEINLNSIIILSAILVNIGSLVYVHKVSDNTEIKLLQDISYYFLNGSWNNGGALGTVVGGILLTLIGKYGAFIILYSLLIILILLFTRKPLFKIVNVSVKKNYNKTKKYVKETTDKFSESLQQQKARKKKNQNIRFIIEDEEDTMSMDEMEKAFEEAKEKVIHEKLEEAKEKEVQGKLEESENIVKTAEQEFIYEEKIEPSIIETSELVGKANEEKVKKTEEMESRVFEKIEIEPSAIEIAAKEMPKKIEPSVEHREIPTTISDNTKIETVSKKEMEKKNSTPYIYKFPSIELLNKKPLKSSDTAQIQAELQENAIKLEKTLESFGVEAKVLDICRGPAVTRYEIQPKIGVKVSKIVGLTDDIALSLAATGIRMEAPIPGKSAIGIEVPNKEVQAVYLREILESKEFHDFDSKLAFGVGKDISGNIMVSDISKMPHALIAGATGSGKSVCINTLITSIIYKADPKEVKLIMIDPKVVELSIYNGIPHLLIPVVTEPQKAASALNWAVQEMDTRYKAFAQHNVRDIKGYNSYKKENGEEDFMPHIVIIIDELADLMMTTPKEVEDSICRLAQKARAAGMHLIIATQRPSVDVITGVIKANIPSRIAFAVSSGIDSRTILDTVGAEKLLGRGDMLFAPYGTNKPTRIQGAFISDKEVERIVEFVKFNNSEVEYNNEVMEKIDRQNNSDGKSEAYSDGDDELLQEAIDLVIDKEKASITMLQRYFRIGFNKAARLMEELEKQGVVGPDEGSKPRKVLINKSDFDKIEDMD